MADFQKENLKQEILSWIQIYFDICALHKVDLIER